MLSVLFIGYAVLFIIVMGLPVSSLFVFKFMVAVSLFEVSSKVILITFLLGFRLLFVLLAGSADDSACSVRGIASFSFVISLADG